MEGELRMNLQIKGWENVPDNRKQNFYLQMEKLLDEYELFGVFE